MTRQILGTYIIPMRLVKDVDDVTISNAELLDLAKKNPLPPEFFEGEEERPW